MKKILLFVVLLFAFGGYVLYRSTSTTVGFTATTSSTSTPAKPQLPSAPTVASEYKNGQYVGPVVHFSYGDIQVQAYVAGGKIANVLVLHYPKGTLESRRINNTAVPELTQQAMTAQSAAVNGVSGASATSAGFRKSLASALAQAKA